MTKPDLMAELAGCFGFSISDDECRILTYTGGGCRPANANECLMWDALRAHHAELEAAVRDAARYDWLRAIGEPEAEIMFRAQMYAGTPPDLMDEAIDEQMHNSAREG